LMLLTNYCSIASCY